MTFLCYHVYMSYTCCSAQAWITFSYLSALNSFPKRMLSRTVACWIHDSCSTYIHTCTCYSPEILSHLFARRKLSPISLSALIGEIFIMQIYCSVLLITQRMWRPLLHWQNLFHRLFLQYKCSWAWRNFCQVKTFHVYGILLPIQIIIAISYCTHVHSLVMLDQSREKGQPH